MRVLIADASVIWRHRLAHGLATELPNVEVVGQAKDAPEGARLIRQLKPDVIILDVLLPGGSGIDLLTDIRKTNPFALAIVLTNYLDGETRQRCMHQGADHFLAKSDGLELLLAVLKRVRRSPPKRATAKECSPNDPS